VTTRVFVYGSLLCGGRYHELVSGSTFAGVATTPARYTLVDLGPYPALVDGGDTAVTGEIYQVDAATLEALDRLEGHPDEYRRVTIRLADGAPAETYLMPRDRARGTPIVSGDWRRR
jgi:gamma-glutamylcyclotransferase (GGCT)/AIG2-like uncharacterized protein YtfP